MSSQHCDIVASVFGDGILGLREKPGRNVVDPGVDETGAVGQRTAELGNARAQRQQEGVAHLLFKPAPRHKASRVGKAERRRLHRNQLWQQPLRQRGIAEA